MENNEKQKNEKSKNNKVIAWLSSHKKMLLISLGIGVLATTAIVTPILVTQSCSNDNTEDEIDNSAIIAAHRQKANEDLAAFENANTTTIPRLIWEINSYVTAENIYEDIEAGDAERLGMIMPELAHGSIIECTLTPTKFVAGEKAEYEFTARTTNNAVFSSATYSTILTSSDVVRTDQERANNAIGIPLIASVKQTSEELVTEADVMKAWKSQIWGAIGITFTVENLNITAKTATIISTCGTATASKNIPYNVEITPNTAEALFATGDEWDSIDTWDSYVMSDGTGYLLDWYTGVLVKHNVTTNTYSQIGTSRADYVVGASGLYDSLAIDGNFGYILSEEEGYLIKVNLTTGIFERVGVSSADNAIGATSDEQGMWDNDMIIRNGFGYLTDTHTGMLVKVKLNTGEFSRVGDSSGDSILGESSSWETAFRYWGGFGYILEENGVLVKVNLTNGEFTRVGNSTATPITGGIVTTFAIDNNGVGYALGLSSGKPIKFNLSDGEMVPLGSSSADNEVHNSSWWTLSANTNGFAYGVSLRSWPFKLNLATGEFSIMW